jgi:hypothetical protein
MSGSATLKTKPTVFAKVNHEAREVRDSLFGEAEFMLTNDGCAGLGGGERVQQAPGRETYRAFRRSKMQHYDSSITCASICSPREAGTALRMADSNGRERWPGRCGETAGERVDCVPSVVRPIIRVVNDEGAIHGHGGACGGPIIVASRKERGRIGTAWLAIQVALD